MRASHYTLWALAVRRWPSPQNCVDQLKFERVILKNIFKLLGDYDSYKVAHHFGKVETHTVLMFFQ